MHTIVKKWGDSAAVRIPAVIMEAISLDFDETVDIHQENRRIIIEPIRANQYGLDRLLAKITRENLHAEAGFGPAVGRENL